MHHAPQADPRAPTAIQLRQSPRILFRAVTGDHAVIVRVDAGEKRLRLGDQAWRVGTGALSLLPAGLAMDVENRPAPGGLYRATALSIPDDLAVPRGPFRGGSVMSGPALASFERALALARSAAPPAICRHAAVEVLLWLREAGLVLPDPETTLADRLRRLIAPTLDHGWTADLAAHALGMSVASLRRRLAEEGTGFAVILTEARLSRALGLLQATDLPVGTIAADVGYAWASRFAHRFRLRFGLAPGQIRGSDRIGAETDRAGTAPAIAGS